MTGWDRVLAGPVAERYWSVLELSQSVAAFAGSPSVVVRVIRFEGFGGRRDGEAMLHASNGRKAGSLLGGAADAVLAGLDHSVPARLEVPVGDAEAVHAGLACGGMAELFVQPLGSVPTQVWELINRREPFVLMTVLDGPRIGESTVVVGETMVGGNGSDPRQSAALDHLRIGRARIAVIETADGTTLLETVSPAPHMVIIGAVELATAIGKQGALLGWSSTVVDERVSDGVALSSAAAATLGPVDALAVLSHDLPASCAAIASALRGRCGYIGALGSRHTQGARRERLISVEQISEKDADRVHGPIGLDLGSRTPEETALAIFAEILAVRRGRNGARLSSGSGPING